VPTGFLPEEDQGAFFVMVQLPDGASVARTSAADATKKAMAQITAPIIAITLVLLSVFVPIAFIPGLSGT
jgi:multidrug efflux pump subunit AcrB